MPEEEKYPKLGVQDALSEIRRDETVVFSSGISLRYVVDNLRLFTSSLLAIGLWVILASVTYWHLYNVSSLNQLLMERTQGITTSEHVEVLSEPIKAAISNLDSVTDRLYGIILPLATAISAYYFAEKSISRARQEDHSRASKKK